jgi:isopentenyl-diphosphate Delta-isomerase
MRPINQNIIINQVDYADDVIGRIVRRDVFNMGANFRVVHVWLFNSAGEMLIQQLASTHLRYPGAWGSSVAGFVLADEIYDAAAKRLLTKELNATQPDPEFWFKTAMDDQGCKKFIAVYKSKLVGPFLPVPDESSSIQFLKISHIKQLSNEGKLLLTPTFAFLLQSAP